MEMKICAYARTAVDLNAGISGVEEQKKYLTEYIRRNFPKAAFDPEKDTFLDPNASGYDFKRSTYQEMKAAMVRGDYNVLVMKDLSRIGRRVSLGVTELTDLLSHGIRIITCDDGAVMEKNLDAVTVFGLILAEGIDKTTNENMSNALEGHQKKRTWSRNSPNGNYIRQRF
jgi:DNA invertase Pin-like site-specific DNA recombinase